jgi:uncharacterized protein (TIGR03066 family)
MKALRLLVTAVTVCSVAAGARAPGEPDKKDKPDYAKLLIGSWEATKTAPDALPVGTMVEFDKQGKVRLTYNRDGTKSTIEYTYKVDGDKFIVEGKTDGMAVMHAVTIKKISDTELVTEDEKGKITELKRKK